jgi:hypothetical protein
VADDKTAHPASHDDPAAVLPQRRTATPADLPTGAADLPTGAAAVIFDGPPAMPAASAVAADPGLPTSAAPPGTSSPPAMPTATAGPTMPTAAAAVRSAGPPAMPPASAAATAAPSMPTAAASPITSGPPAIPGAPTAPPSMPTLAGSAIHSGPPAIPDAPGQATAVPPPRYQLKREIARGGMGRVVEADDRRLGRLVAFKEALTRDADTLRRFERETQITARLEHPSIVPVYDAGESSNGAPFYVMRKVSGRPLEHLVAGADTLSQRLALIPHIVDSAQAIAHAHERGIVHRDIKPANILIGDLGETVVIDWGLAKVIGEADAQTARPLVDLSDALKTRVGIVYGTPGFMAPEQLRGAPVDERCDVYALGATLYHLLARTPPHHAKTADEMMRAAVAAPPTPVGELVEGVPPDLSTIVDKALAHDPTVRYQNARALAEDLQRFLTGQLVKSHHYSTRDRIVRFVRKNRGVSAAALALVVVGTLSVIRIIGERNRADAAAHEARRAEQTAVLRAERLTLSQARSNVEVDPTKAVATIKPLATKYWREVRAIATAARATGVAWGLAASRETRSLEMSRDGQRVLAAGGDGVVRIHDLVHRATRLLVDLRTPASARFAAGERMVVAWHDRRLAIIDVATGTPRSVQAATPIIDLETVAATAYWVDAQHAVWRLDLAAPTAAPERFATPEPVREISASPDGRWLALLGEDHLLLHDLGQASDAFPQVAIGNTRQVAWSADGASLAVLMDQQGGAVQEVIDVDVTPAPMIVHRQSTAHRYFVAHAAGRLYTVGLTGVAVVGRTELGEEPIGRKQLHGQPVGLVESRAGTVVAGAASGLTVMSDDGDRVLPMQAARFVAVVASPRSPFVVAQLEGRLLVWDLDQVQPRRIAEPPVDGAAFAGSNRVLLGGTAETPAQLIDLTTATSQPVGDWAGLLAATATSTGQLAAVIDRAHHLHLVGPGRPSEELAGAIDIAGFATDNLLVLATLDGGLYLHDVARRQRTPLVPRRAHLLGLAWGNGHHPWVAAAFDDGKLWRKNVVTGAEATTSRIPRLDAANPSLPDGELLVASDGTVVFLHATEAHAWRPDGAIERIVGLATPIVNLGEAGADQIIAFTRDNRIYSFARTAPASPSEALPSITGTSPAMSADTGLIVVVNYGAVDVVDPLGHHQWTLAPAAGVTFSHPRISTDGLRVLALTHRAILVWSLELPDGPAATARWVDALTNAVDDDRAPGGLSWR